MSKRLIVRILSNAFIFCIIAVLTSDPSYGLTVIDVDLTSVKQKIEGFGGNGAFLESWLSAHPKKLEIYNLIFGDLGTSIYRIRNSYETGYYPSDMEHQAEAIQAAADSLGHPVKVIISSWTPPNYLKSNNSFAGGTLALDPNGDYKYNEFTEWWAHSLMAYQQLGVTATYISIQNEPSLSLEYPSCKFTESETEDWAGHDQALDAVYQRLSTMQERPKILGPDTINTMKAKPYIDAISDLTQVYGYAHHLYGMGTSGNAWERFDNPDSYIPQMRTFRQYYYGDKPIFQTEYSRGPGDSDEFREAINTAKHIHNSLVEENVAAYMVWGLFWGKDMGRDGMGLVLIDDPYNTVNPGYKIRDTYYALKHYSKFIQPGYSRINISNPNVSGLRASAFKSSDGGTIVLVIINPEENSKGITVSGLDAYRFCQVFRTDSSPVNNCTDIFNNWDGNLPGKSITTIIANSSCDSFRFVDIPSGYWAKDEIYKMYDAGITKGCSQNPLRYCPEKIVTRDQMAVFLGRGIHGSSYTPSPASGIFDDVPADRWAADWIEQFYYDGITMGCPYPNFCPSSSVNRDQMAVFLLRAKHGSNYTPPPATGIFDDVPKTRWAADWIEQLYREGITMGCPYPNFCPNSSVTRAQMAKFLVRTFGL